MATLSSLGTSALALTLTAHETFWLVEDSIISADSSIGVARRMATPSSTGIEYMQKESLCLQQNHGSDPALLVMGGPLNSHLTYLAPAEGPVIVRSSSFVGADDGGTPVSHEPIFSHHPDYERTDWLEFRAYAHLIVSSRGTLFRVPVDGEHLIDVDTIVAFNSRLAVAPVGADGSAAARRLAGIHQPIFRFTGRGSLWCHAGRTRGYGRLLRSYRKSGGGS